MYRAKIREFNNQFPVWRDPDKLYSWNFRIKSFKSIANVIRSEVKLAVPSSRFLPL